MDQFYLKNVGLYQRLVNKYDPTSDAKLICSAETPSSDLIVIVRIRPLLDDDLAAGFPSAVFPYTANVGAITIHDLYNHPKGRPILKTFNYRVDDVYRPGATTEEIYDSKISNMVSLAWNGGIGTLFAYGQTGSGKTYTISRIQQLVSESLMESLEGQKHVSMSIIDLAGNSAFDLLNSRQPISILEDSRGITQWTGAKEYPVQEKNEVMGLIEQAASFRRTAPTLKNPVSSRSHSICRIRIKDTSTEEQDGLLYLIDLAGSESARDRTEHSATQMREAREINTSLSVLKDCIRGKVESLVQKTGPNFKQNQPSHIPFRRSTITRILKHVFDPSSNLQCKTVVVACVNPSLADVGPTKNTLRYAEMLRVLVPTSSENLKGPMSWNNRQLETSAMASVALAPTENGAQMLRLTPIAFEYRCSKIPGVDLERAKALRAKLWQLHVESQQPDGQEHVSPKFFEDRAEPLKAWVIVNKET
ncbi:P-loop containing nucleoside triphosphate hydrolase protein [Acrodontium crateriforme]|uniref:P-loop containing nucleoside triphosphate hydrolase protein n=1 Tax=Acrodontium crateriforme TaxID=150365 RepID=A0AAQ3R9P1_9PEZI|nr:P-loop containing nucleoside triphosphate hydrolase protein [Acrodontium crateriforme]